MRFSTFARRLLLCSTPLILAACGGETVDPPAAGTYDCAGTTAVTTAQIQAALFDAQCVECHTPGKEGSTDMRTAALTQELVGRQSVKYGPLKIVDPGNLQNSTLYLKVLGGSPRYKGPNGEDVGARMPNDRPALPDSDKQMVKNWICSGANP